ncbi:MAG TPA: hypothetical protein VFW50_28810 [Streptosporangiaceae bacterium]|nr:hypothetical protein [Streptosporangiaceae bacterium]
MVLLDVTRGDDRHTSGRLAAEPVIWLGTVRRDGRPQAVLVRVERITAWTRTAAGVAYRTVPAPPGVRAGALRA